MLDSLGFDTIIIHTSGFDKNIFSTFELFYPLGIKNYILLLDYDPLTDSIPLLKARLKEIKNFYTSNSMQRIKIKCALNMHICNGAAFNPSINQIYANNNSKILFTSLPLFTDANYQDIALDINHLLYKKSALPIFTSFNKSIESSNYEFCSKFVHNSKIGLSIDINYLFDPQKKAIFNDIVKSNSLVLPSVSSDTSNYAGIHASANYILEAYGKKSYYALCSQMNRCSAKIAF